MLGLIQGHRGVKCRAPYCWLSHLHQPARSPCPPCIDLIWPGDKAVIGWGLGIRWPFLAWLIPLFLGLLGLGPKGQAKVNPIQSPVLWGPALPSDLTPLPNTADMTSFKLFRGNLISLPHILHLYTTTNFTVKNRGVLLKTKGKCMQNKTRTDSVLHTQREFDWKKC